MFTIFPLPLGFARSAFGAVVISIVSNMATADVISNIPTALPSNYIMDLQASGGDLVPIVGSEGTVYVRNLYIQDFSLTSVSSSGGNTFETYSATYFENLLNSNGQSLGVSLSLPGGSVQVEEIGRTSPYQTGTFTEELFSMVFSGTSAFGNQPLTLSIDTSSIVPTGQLSIAPILSGINAGKYDISVPALTVQGVYEYTLTGKTYDTPLLHDVNGISPVPVPALLVPMIPALLGVLGLLRRRAA